jgi:mannose-1-phosphate guanylyltransferase
MMNNNYCIIMAGGIGSRFWPMSRKDMPKQFLDILGTGRTLLQQAFDRFSKLIPVENFYVVTSVDYTDLVQNQLPELSKGQILGEPLRRNTAPCIAYAANKIKSINPNANLIVAPSDHLIQKEEEFLRQISKGLDFVANKRALLTLGIHPSRPETGYGYIQIGEKSVYKDFDNLHQVKTFTEKPDIQMAEIFVDSGEFFWNSGIFLWSLPTILRAFEAHLNEVSVLFAQGEHLYNTPDEKPFINKIYSECMGISIDYGIMEKSDNVYVLTADFGWSDLGTWGSLYENKEKDENGNVVSGPNVLSYDISNCIVNMPGDKIAVLQGLDGFIVVESNNTLLICRREDEQQIRQFVNDVQLKNGPQFV